MALAKSLDELIARLNSYTVRELVDDLVSNGKPSGMLTYEWILTPNDDLTWSEFDGHVWDTFNIYRL